ncbi:GNAT family N-acetyltransferase [Lactiplantibacillus sp. WILCCON 0030]|uniref:GNAT family N-acetyltransferase n=1 Tax=Lactiplantibacillus brownii TaxID=3069269 RepID=A0ABU1A785_9LACO|nr:GNAT family N-acetyltransferase [Lactiplantibacillus brownii]MDQ7936303.1 GNAT family N-acetyltransferase [Lactiplantibacillus brownii]
MEITSVKMTDLPQLLTIEKAGFSAAEAGSEAAYRERIEKLAATFLVARDGDEILGFIVGPAVKARYIEDEMFAQTPTNLDHGGHQLVFTLAVSPLARHQKIGSQLLTALEKVARSAQRESMALTCLARLVPFYERNGYHNQGVADSSHAGETWYNLEKKLE